MKESLAQHAAAVDKGVTRGEQKQPLWISDVLVAVIMGGRGA